MISVVSNQQSYPLYDPHDFRAYSAPGCCCSAPVRSESCVSVMRTHKSYFALVLVPYLFLIVMFHSQLQLYDSGAKTKVLEEEVAFRGHESQNEAFRFRDLMKHGTLSEGPKYLAKPLDNPNGGGMVFESVLDVKVNVNIPKSQESYIAVNDSKSVIHERNNDHKDSDKNRDAEQIPTHKIPELDELPATKLLFESQSQHSHDSMWSSSYPILHSCRDAPITQAVPNVQFQPLLSHWVYTAYYDERDPKAPTVRVIVLLKKVDKPGLFCHFATTEHPVNSEDFVTVMPNYYEMCENHAKDYGGWILSCDVPSELSKPPCEVVVSINSIFNPKLQGNAHVPVFKLTSPKRQAFGVCIPPIFGYIPSTTLVEFIEMTRLLGAAHMVFYAHQASREIQKVLRYYHQQGAITVINWELPLMDKHIWYHGQLLAINDCLYRNMHRFQYLAFNDLDEFIVPHSQGSQNWTDMIRKIQDVALQQQSDPQGHCGYSFQSAFFDPLSSGTRVLYDLESDLRTKSFSTVRTKTMVKPERMFELGIHHMSRPISDNYKPYYVLPAEAYIHHYRKCVTDFDPKMNCQVFARDESLSPYIPSLRHNVHQTLWTLKEMEKRHSQDGQNAYVWGT